TLGRMRDWSAAADSLARAASIYERTVGKSHSRGSHVRQELANARARKSGWAPGDAKGGAVVVRCTTEGCKGLETGDWALQSAPTKIRDARHLPDLAAAARTSPASVAVIRDGKRITVTVRGGEQNLEAL